MAKEGKRKRRINTYFRQTASAFRAARQTQVFSHLNRRLPYNIYSLTKKEFNRRLQKIHARFQNSPLRVKR